MGHSNQEIDLDSLKDLKREKIRRNVTHITMPNGKTVVLLADVRVYLKIHTCVTTCVFPY
jgi:S-adenosylhomocysteine hydrolase